MSGVARRAAGLAMAVLAVAIVAGGSRWPWRAAPDDLALIRLDWRARGERVEECRPPTPEEIAERPAHMRPREICEGKVTPYALRVEVDGEVVINDTIHGAGAREDRPLYVAREIAVRPGSREVRIDFDRIDDRSERRASGITPSVRLAGSFRLTPRQVLVVTYDAERGRLAASAGSQK